VSKLTSLISAFKRAAGEVFGEVSAIDKRIKENRRQREAFLAERVSKEDFIGYVSRTVELKGKPFEQRLQRMVGNMDLTLGRLEIAMKHAGGISLPLLKGEAFFPEAITEDAVFYYFGEIVTQRIGDAVASLDWPKGVMPAAERLKMIERLDAEYAGLLEQRQALEAELKDAGISDQA
jgi:hypothetical protein